MHLPMWAFKQGRPLPKSRGNSLLQRGSKKQSCAISTISRTAKEGGALTTRSAPFKQSKSPVMWRDSGRWTPCKSGFSRVRAISAALAGLWDQR